MKFPHDMQKLKPSAIAKGSKKEMEIPERYRDLCSLQGCPMASVEKVYEMDVWIDKGPISISIKPTITLKLHDQNGNEVMCASFPIRIR